jgi:hypothetical protein
MFNTPASYASILKLNKLQEKFTKTFASELHTLFLTIQFNIVFNQHSFPTEPTSSAYISSGDNACSAHATPHDHSKFSPAIFPVICFAALSIQSSFTEETK